MVMNCVEKGVVEIDVAEKFSIDRSDIIPLTELASKVTGLDTYEDILKKELENI
jgi:hypothetical protein